MNADVAHRDRLAAIRRRLERPLDYRWHAHGIGMLRTYLDDERMVRLNLWHSRLLNPGISTMHTHPRPFVSTAYAGLMQNVIYERVTERPWSKPYREGIIHCGDAFNGIENDPPLVHLLRKDSQDIRAGQTYRLPPRVIHDTVFHDGTVTVMEWERDEPDICASVFWPDGEQWGDATRAITPEDIVFVCAAAHARFLEAWL